MGDQKANLLNRINRHDWYHTPPEAGPKCYEQRGRFYAATYAKAAEYGKPNINPDGMRISNPLIGDDQETDNTLFGRSLGQTRSYRDLCEQEARRKRRALQLGYDAILLLPVGATAKVHRTGRIPAGAELTLLDLSLSHTKVLVPITDGFCTEQPPKKASLTPNRNLD